MNRRTPSFLWLLLLALLAGCGGRPLAEVKGTVTYKGKPLEVPGCQIVFMSDEQKVFLGATLKEDGTYRVRMAEGYGLPPGTYKVAILFPQGYNPSIPANMSKEDAHKLFDSKIPSKYHSEKTSGLVVEVPPGGTEFNVTMVDDAKK